MLCPGMHGWNQMLGRHTHGPAFFNDPWSGFYQLGAAFFTQVGRRRVVTSPSLSFASCMCERLHLVQLLLLVTLSQYLSSACPITALPTITVTTTNSYSNITRRRTRTHTHTHTHSHTHAHARTTHTHTHIHTHTHTHLHTHTHTQAHVTQFTEFGWHFVANASGQTNGGCSGLAQHGTGAAAHPDGNEGNTAVNATTSAPPPPPCLTYAALADSDAKDFSLVVVNTGSAPGTLSVGLAGEFDLLCGVGLQVRCNQRMSLVSYTLLHSHEHLHSPYSDSDVSFFLLVFLFLCLLSSDVPLLSLALALARPPAAMAINRDGLLCPTVRRGCSVRGWRRWWWCWCWCWWCCCLVFGSVDTRCSPRVRHHIELPLGRGGGVGQLHRAATHAVCTAPQSVVVDASGR
jgi:hypothetical protein